MCSGRITLGDVVRVGSQPQVATRSRLEMGWDNARCRPGLARVKMVCPISAQGSGGLECASGRIAQAKIGLPDSNLRSESFWPRGEGG